MRTNLLLISVLSLAFGIVNCGSSADPTGGSGGAPNAGSAGSGTSNAGNSNANPAGGAAAIGNTGNAGTGFAGYSTGGTNATGGGGTGNTGNTAAGGASTGGTSTGGTSTGGASIGGASIGGAGSGGKAGAGGAGTGGTASGCTMGTTHTGGTQHCSNSQGNLSNGYSYQLWSNGVGSGCMTPYGGDAAFKANWSNVGDFLARVGLGWNSSQTYDQLGTIAADFAYTKTGSGGGFSFIGIYGWSVNPLVEYYIVEDWYGSGPPTGGGTKKGSFTVDGGTYNVYTHTQTNQPSITGSNATFPQFFSVRQTARQCGHISITEHFKQWASLGMTLGKMEEARILVEVGGGTGSIDFTTAAITAH